MYSAIPSTCPAPCNLLLTSFSVKLFCTPIPSLNSTILLTINESEICCELFDLLTSQSLFPHITLPTILTNGGGTLIDNLFCKMNKSIKKNTAGILLNQLSDHLPCFTLLETDNIVHNSKPKFTRILKQNDDVIQQIKNEINYSELHKKTRYKSDS